MFSKSYALKIIIHKIGDLNSIQYDVGHPVIKTEIS